MGRYILLTVLYQEFMDWDMDTGNQGIPINMSLQA
jgi:hypothetical protein